MSGYDSVNRNLLSRVWKVVRDGADVTSGGRQFHTSNRKCSAADSGTVNWRRGRTADVVQCRCSIATCAGFGSYSRDSEERLSAVSKLLSRSRPDGRRF